MKISHLNLTLGFLYNVTQLF